MDKRQYSIGDYVLVSQTVESGYDEEGKNKIPVHTTIIIPRVGQIVGLKRMFFGKRCGATYDEEDGELVELPYLEITCSMLPWEVRFGLLNKPVYVLTGCLTPTEKKPLPLLYREPKETYTPVETYTPQGFLKGQNDSQKNKKGKDRDSYV